METQLLTLSEYASAQTRLRAIQICTADAWESGDTFTALELQFQHDWIRGVLFFNYMIALQRIGDVFKATGRHGVGI
jgi:hypothetical protein